MPTSAIHSTFRTLLLLTWQYALKGGIIEGRMIDKKHKDIIIMINKSNHLYLNDDVGTIENLFSVSNYLNVRRFWLKAVVQLRDKNRSSKSSESVFISMRMASEGRIEGARSGHSMIDIHGGWK